MKKLFNFKLLVLFGVMVMSINTAWGDESFKNAWLKYNLGGDDVTKDIANDQDLGTGTKLELVAFYLDCHDNWGAGRTCWNGGAIYYSTNGGSTFTEVINNATTWKQYGWEEDDYQFRKESMGITIKAAESASGSYSIKVKSKVWGDHDTWIYGDGNSDRTWTYKIYPPDVTGFTVNINNRVAGDTGDGSENNPYIITWGVNPTVSVSSPTVHHTDANSSMQYKYGTGSWGTSTSTTVSPSTSKQSITISARRKNNSDETLVSASTLEQTIWYQWEDPYTIIVQTNGVGTGAVSPSTVYTKGDVASASFTAWVPVADAAKYEFVDWSATSGVTLQSSPSSATNTVKSTGNGTVTANFQCKQYAITYSPVSASHCTYTTTPANARYGNTVNLTITPDANYVISSVTAVDASSNTVTVSGSSPNYSFTMPASNVTVTIVTALNKVTVTYGAGSNGSLSAKVGEDDIDSGDEVNGGSQVDFTASPNPGYEVEGWYETYDEGEFDDKIDAAGTDETYTIDEVTSDVSVYVQFKLSTYDIHYENMSGATNHASNPETYQYTTSTITLQDPSKTGYTFGGWYSDNGTWNTQVTSIPQYSTGDVTIYAKWTANSYDVEFKANGGSGSMSNQDFTYDAAQSLTSVNYTRAGYTFGGWATSKANADAGTKAYDDGESVSNLTSTDGATVELWAIWTARPYKIVCIVKPTSWTNVYAYAYKDNGGSAATNYNATWPGIRLDNDLQGTGLTASDEDACNTYYYKFYTDGGASDAEGNGTAVGGAASAWDKVIFNNGDNPGSEGSTKTRSLNINASNGTTRYYLLTDAAAATGATSAYASEWYLRGNFNGTDKWSSWSYPLSMNCATSTGYVVMSSLSSSNDQYFRIYDISTGNIFKYTGGASAVYDADYDISSEIGNSLTMRSYGTTGANKFRPVSTTDYRFTLNTTNPMNPVLVVAPDNDEDYTASSGLYDGTPDGCSVTEITELHQYTPTSLTATAAPGYRFKQWRYTGCSLAAGSTATSNPASFTATANGGEIEAEFTNEGFIYLDKSSIKNSWGGTPYVYFYSTSYWDSSDAKKGSGSKTGGGVTVYGPYEMSRIGDSQIWYYDYSSSVGMANTKNYIAFNDHSQANYNNFVACLAIYRGDFYQKQNMFVAKDYKYYYNTGAAEGQAVYYNDGYWRKYNETDPGYVVKTYNAWGGGVCTGTYRFSSSERGARNCTVDVPLNSGPNYFKVVGCDTTTINSVAYSGTFYRDEYGAGTMSSDNSTNWLLVDKSGSNTGVQATASGDYKFTLTLGEGNLYISVDFPMSVGDFRLMYNGKMRTTYVAKKKHESNFIRKLKAPVVATDTLKRDTVSFFIDPSKDNGSLAPSLGFQWCSKIVGYTVTWRDTLSSISLSSIYKAGVYDFVITQTNNKSGTHTISCALKGAYKGNYYIRTNAAAGAWKTYKESADNMLNYSDYSKAHSGYDYYYCNWVGTNENVKFTIANDYSECVTDTVEGDDYVPSSGDNVGKLPYEASVRFMMDSKTNAIWRAYLNGSNEGTADYLKILSNPARTSTDSETKTDNAEIIDSNGSTFTNNSVKFKDLGNWVYQIDLKVLEAARIKLVSNYYFSSTNHEQYFKGKSGDWADANTEEILGGSENAYRDLRIVYDYKTNHLISAWLVTDDQITGGTAKAINTDLMILRKDQGDAKQITFSSGTSLTAVDTVYSVMQFSFNHIANKKTTDNTTDSTLYIYEREYYWVSFPYDVKINDIFGSLGDFNNEWGIMYYDGKERAQKGYWSDSKGFWKYFPDQSGTLKAFEGYVLGVDVGLVGTALNTGKWKNTVRDVYLYFPSSRKINSIVQKDTTISIDQTDYQCTIDRTGNNGSDINKNRTIADSYWHVIGAPSFKNVSHTTGSSWPDTDADSKVDLPKLSDWSTTDVPFLYEWSKATNTYTPMTSSSYTFKPMYSYMVQYNKPTITWSSVTAPIPPASVAARSLAENGDVEWRIDLLLATDSQDRTYVRMSNDEAVTAGFEFNYDLTKEYNKSKANIYTFAGYVPVAGNIMPRNTINTTVIPMGVKITTNGEYTFTLPEGMNGIGITLVDNIKNTRTNLALTDYTVELTKGTYDDRFTLEISPISQTPTDVRTIGNEGSESGVRKVIVDGLLYIVKEGVAYDARGNRVK